MIYALHDSEDALVHPTITITNSLMLFVMQIIETTTTRVTYYNTFVDFDLKLHNSNCFNTF